MNICHRYLAQYMLKNGVATVNDALAYCKQISQGRIENMTQFKTLVIELNREISKQYYKIVFNICEVTQRKIIVWLNTKNDDISKHQISYSALELEYFHAILQEILASEEYRITDNGQKVLNKWLERGYYIKNGDFIHLGPRLILEFTSYLRTHCPESICKLCSELVFTGKWCSHCQIMLHSYCLSKYLENQTNCPCCKNVWEMSEADAEDMNMITDQADYTINSEEFDRTLLTTNHIHDEPVSSKQSSRRKDDKDSEDEESYSDDDDNQSVRNLRKRPKRASVARK